MLSNIKKISGFTMIDLLIWLAIFGVLTGSMIANFRAGGRNDNVRSGAELLSSTLRSAQSKTLSGALAPNSDFPDGGWGVHFDSASPGEMIVFADGSIPSNYIYNAGEEAEAPIALPGGAQFSWAEQFPVLDVVFSPPDGKIYFNGQDALGKMTLTISQSGAGIQKQVEIFRLSGQIRAQ